MASRTRPDGVIVPVRHAAFGFDEVCDPLNVVCSGPIADLRVGRPSGHVVPHPVPVVRNTAEPPSPPSSTPDTPYPGRTIPGVTLSVPSMTDHRRARARLLYTLDLL